jgi:hypothetical protein
MARDAGAALRGVGEDRDASIDALLEEMRFWQRPAVVIVEDAYWADDASLDIIRYLARRIERLPAMLVVSYRDEELGDDHPLRRIIGSLAGPAMLHVELQGLSDAAVAQLAASAGVDPGPLMAAVGGNPFYLTEVLASPGSAVPSSVRHAVLARVAALPRPCRAALEQLAVIPAEAERWLAAALLGDPAVLEPAERRGMLVAPHGRIRFRHELARRVVELSLPSSRRADYHGRALAALAAAGPSGPVTRWRCATASWARRTPSRRTSRPRQTGRSAPWTSPASSATARSSPAPCATGASPGCRWTSRPASPTCGGRSRSPTGSATATG